MNTKENNNNENNGSVKSPRFTARHRAGKKPSVPVKSARATAKPHKKPLNIRKAVGAKPGIGSFENTVQPIQSTESASDVQIETEADTPVESKSTTATFEKGTTSLGATDPQDEPSPAKSVTHLKLVKNLVDNNRKLFTGGFIATLVVSIIAGSTFGIGKMLPVNTGVVQFVTGMITDAHADQLSQQGKISDAILEYEKAIQQSPNDLTAYKKLATIYELETREWTKATKVLKDALIINDSDFDVHRLLAYAQFWNGETMDAAKSAQKAIDLHRGDALATSTMALIVAAGGDLSKGKDLIQQSMNTDSNNAAVISNAALFYRLYAKDDNKAEELIRKAIKMAPNDVNNWWELSNVLRNQNKKDDAEQALRKAHTMQPDSGFRTADLASYLGSTSVKKYDEAADLYRQAISQGFDDASTVDALAAALFNGGKYSEAAVQYQKAADLQPGNAQYVLMLGRSQYEAKNYTAAKDAFTKLVGMDGKYTSYNWLGVAYFAAGDYNAAVSTFNAALKINSNDATLWANLANATDKLGDTFDAADYAFNGLDLDSNNDTVWSTIDQIGNHMIKNNQRDLAREFFSEAAEYQSTSAGRSQVVTDLNRLS